MAWESQEQGLKSRKSKENGNWGTEEAGGQGLLLCDLPQHHGAALPISIVPSALLLYSVHSETLLIEKDEMPLRPNRNAIGWAICYKYWSKNAAKNTKIVSRGVWGSKNCTLVSKISCGR